MFSLSAGDQERIGVSRARALPQLLELLYTAGKENSAVAGKRLGVEIQAAPVSLQIPRRSYRHFEGAIQNVIAK